MSNPIGDVLSRIRHQAIQVKNVARTRWVMRSCDHLGHLARIAEGNVIVDNAGSIDIGAHTRFFGTYAPVELRTGSAGRLTIGERSSLRWGSSVYVADSVTIGDGTRIGAYTIISDVEVGGLDSPDTEPPRPITIGDGVWIATRVVVRPGVQIGDGAVVGAGSVVDSDVPARAVVAGAPARVLRRLDADDEAGPS